MKAEGSRLIVAGGFIRSCVSNDTVNDVDVFCGSKDYAREIALRLVDNDRTRIYETDNALTLRGFSFPIQFIHRWTFDDPRAAVCSFDFTIARAAFWCDKTPDMLVPGDGGIWKTVCDPRFYPDLAGKRLVYCQPIRNEEAGGSLLRVLKFYQRGYRVPLDSLAAVIARMFRGVDLSKIQESFGVADETQLAKVLTGLLREVDPSVDPSHIAHLPSEAAAEAQPDVAARLY